MPPNNPNHKQTHNRNEPQPLPQYYDPYFSTHSNTHPYIYHYQTYSTKPSTLSKFLTWFSQNLHATFSNLLQTLIKKKPTSSSPRLFVRTSSKPILGYKPHQWYKALWIVALCGMAGMIINLLWDSSSKVVAMDYICNYHRSGNMAELNRSDGSPVLENAFSRFFFKGSNELGSFENGDDARSEKRNSRVSVDDKDNRDDESMGVLIFAQGKTGKRDNLEEGYKSAQRIKELHGNQLGITIATDAESLSKFMIRRGQEKEADWKEYLRWKAEVNKTRGEGKDGRGFLLERKNAPGPLELAWNTLRIIDKSELTTLKKVGLELCRDCFAEEEYNVLSRYRGTEHDGKLKKIYSFTTTPYKYTMFLDTDIYLCESLLPYFNHFKKESGDLMLTNFYNSRDGFTANLSGIIPDNFTESNSGVVLYNSHSPIIKSFLNTTIHTYLKLLSLRKIPGDQPAFRASMYYNRDKLKIINIPKEEHCRFFWNDDRSDIWRNGEWSCRIVHGDARYRPEKRFIIPCRNEKQVVRTVEEIR